MFLYLVDLQFIRIILQIKIIGTSKLRHKKMRKKVNTNSNHKLHQHFFQRDFFEFYCKYIDRDRTMYINLLKNKVHCGNGVP